MIGQFEVTLNKAHDVQHFFFRFRELSSSLHELHLNQLCDMTLDPDYCRVKTAELISFSHPNKRGFIVWITISVLLSDWSMDEGFDPIHFLIISSFNS